MKDCLHQAELWLSVCGGLICLYRCGRPSLGHHHFLGLVKSGAGWLATKHTCIHFSLLLTGYDWLSQAFSAVTPHSDGLKPGTMYESGHFYHNRNATGKMNFSAFLPMLLLGYLPPCLRSTGKGVLLL